MTLIANPDNNYVFDSYGEPCTGFNCEIIMKTDTTITAKFIPIMYQLNVYSSKNGIVTGTGINCGFNCQKSYNQGTSVTINAEPKPNYKFSGWSGACSNKISSCTLTMNQEQKVTAIFEIVEPDCSYSISPNNRNHNTNSIEDTITITASVSECKWTANSNANWIFIINTNDTTPLPKIQIQKNVMEHLLSLDKILRFIKKEENHVPLNLRLMFQVV